MRATLDLNEVMKEHIVVEVNLRGVLRWTLKMKLGLWLIRLGIWIMGMEYEVSEQ